jgi:adiponectin receptor
VLIVGSFFPCVYYAFYCEPRYRTFYQCLITIAGSGLFTYSPVSGRSLTTYHGTAAAYTVLSPTYGTPEYRGTRTAVFIGLGLCAVFPVTHAAVMQGFGSLTRDLGFGWLLLSGALYIIGALL